MKVVIDASVTVKWFLPDSEDENDLDRAFDLLTSLRDGQIDVVQPCHWLMETAAVVARIRPAMAQDAVDFLFGLELLIQDGPQIAHRAIELAQKLEHHAFDTHVPCGRLGM